MLLHLLACVKAYLSNCFQNIPKFDCCSHKYLFCNFSRYNTNITLRPRDVVTVEIQNLYDTSTFGGTKYVVLSTLNFMGGKNNVLGVTYITVGGFSVLAALLILALSPRFKKSGTIMKSLQPFQEQRPKQYELTS